MVHKAVTLPNSVPARAGPNTLLKRTAAYIDTATMAS